MQGTIKKEMMDSIETKRKVVDTLIPQIQTFIELLVTCFSSGNRVYACGNGGSTCDAMHFVEELVAQYDKKRPGLPAHHLMDQSVLTCWTNDHNFETVFERQVATYCKTGDILIVISTSGNSKNCVAAAEKAREKGTKIIGLLGKTGGDIREICDLPIIIPSNDTARIQESHIMIIHTVIDILEKKLFRDDKNELQRTETHS